MKDIPIENTTAMPLYVAGTMVPPGETRILPEHQVPPHLRPAEHIPEADTAPADALLALLERPIKEIAEAIQARDDTGVPTISDAELTRLQTAEEAGKARKGLMTAIAEEQLRRADGIQFDTLDTLTALVAGMDEDELLAHLELVQGDPSAVAVVEAEIDKRQAPA